MIARCTMAARCMMVARWLLGAHLRFTMHHKINENLVRYVCLFV